MGNSFQDINEEETRKKYIDPLLKSVGWKSSFIKEEVNPVKSDFKNKNFVLYNGKTEKKDLFIDYLLLDEYENPLAIIEAKKFSKNPEEGRIQSRTYKLEIEKQIDSKILIFLTNGRKWYFIDEYGVERPVSGPLSQQDLSRRRNLFNSHKDPSQIRIDSNIVDRSRSVKIVRQLSEHFANCHREALVVMATGTGKTRVAMATIKLLVDSNIVRNVLFIADRITLVNQAKEE